MKKLSNIIFFIAIVCAAVFLLYQKGYILTNYDSITPLEAQNMIKKQDGNVTILDVRTLGEYQQEGHLVNSLLIPSATLASQLDTLQKYKDTKLLVYCRSGNRSAKASRVLSEHGFHVYNIKGGIQEWKKAHLPVETIRYGR